MDQTQESQPQPHPTQLTLQIAYNGVVRPEDHVQKQEAVQAVLQRALALFHVTDRPHAQALFREDGTEVPNNISVADANLTDGQLLYLRPRTPQGG